jgi:hypothetical protein
MNHRTYDGQRFSPLSRINRDMHSLQHTSAEIRAFFQKPSLRYAA